VRLLKGFDFSQASALLGVVGRLLFAMVGCCFVPELATSVA